MYRMGMMAMLAGGSGIAQGAPPVDSVRAMKMALVHDVAEAIVGDITPHCNVSMQGERGTAAAPGIAPGFNCSRVFCIVGAWCW